MDHVLNCFGHEMKLEQIADASNCTLTDEYGNRYIDLESGVWCTSLGHCNSRVTDAIALNAG